MDDQEIMLSEAQVNKIAEKAAEKALEKVYTEVGRSVVTKIMWVIGTVSVALMLWLGSIGKLP